jgi:DNA primase
MAKRLSEVLTEQGLELSDSSGGRKVAGCPFHEGDHDPSFTVYPNNTYFCFGCEAWGDALKFLVDYKHWDFKDAMEYLGDDYRQPKSEKSQVIKVKNSLASYRFLRSIVDQYHSFLLETPGAIRYLEQRGLSMETIKKYKLGYTDGHVLSLYWDWEQELAVETGLIKNGYETLSHRITIPNLTEDDQCDFMVGRTVTSDKVKYLGLRIPKPIHGFYEVRHSPVIFLAEGQFDWLSLRQWGIPAGIIGGSHLSKANLLLLRDKKVVIVPDIDPEGQGMATAQRLQRELGESATILDYSECNTSSGKLDVSSLGESPGGEKLFKMIIMEQLPWIRLLSQRTLQKYLPGLVDLIPSHST